MHKNLVQSSSCDAVAGQMRSQNIKQLFLFLDSAYSEYA